MLEIGLILLPILLLVARQNLIVILFAMAAYVHYFYGDGVLEYIIEDMWIGLDKEVLLSVPLFILCGNVMSKGQISSRLITVISKLTISIPGGLGVATILSCAVFSAISGSSAVTMLSVGAVLYPALINAGYDRKFSLGALTAGGTLGVVIPPSIPLILYGIVTETSITALFKAGAIPGICLTVLMCGYAFYKNRHMVRGVFSGKEVYVALKAGIWSLLMPVILLGGIYSGFFTPTEAAAVALAYAMFVELFIHRDMVLLDFYEISISTAKLLGMLYPLLAIAMSLNIFLTAEQVPPGIAYWVAAQVDNPLMFLLAMNFLLLIVGCFLDINAGILILAPILLPIAVGFGVDPVHLGILMVINLEVGFLTPPIGINLMIAMTAFKEPFALICRSVMPFAALILTMLLLVTFFPGYFIWR